MEELGVELTLPRLQHLSLPRQSLNIPQQQHARRTSRSSIEPRSKDSLGFEVGIADDVEAVDLNEQKSKVSGEAGNQTRRKLTSITPNPDAAATLLTTVLFPLPLDPFTSTEICKSYEPIDATTEEPTICCSSLKGGREVEEGSRPAESSKRADSGVRNALEAKRQIKVELTNPNPSRERPTHSHTSLHPGLNQLSH